MKFSVVDRSLAQRGVVERPLFHSKPPNRGKESRQAARHRPDPPARARVRGADHDRGGSVGGFANFGLQYLRTSGLLDAGLKVRRLVLPDRFIGHASPARQYECAGLNAPQIVATALAALGQSRSAHGSQTKSFNIGDNCLADASAAEYYALD
ncbi:hypothetical protein [Reyranella sp.]|uniref:hypothetical protein n=1 Tax=Reyranella sp. TaxID=1929291 RepID=UPI0040360BE4